MRTLAGPLRLAPAVELEPSSLCDRSWPADEPMAAHWRACADAAGLADVAPIAPGSWCVRASDLLTPPRLALLVRLFERRHGAEDGPLQPDDLCAASGGLALEAPAGTVHVAPRCCGDLGDWTGWRDAAARRGPGWSMLWIGHPWVDARFEAGRVVLSAPHEGGRPVDALSVDAADLAAAVERARLELVALAGALRPIVVARGHDARLADVLAGLSAA